MTKPWQPNVSILPPYVGGRPKGPRQLMIIDEPSDPVWPEMSRLNYLRFAAFIRWTADQMGLRDWRLQLKWEPADLEEKLSCYARCEVLGTIKTANIWLCADFCSLPASEQRRSICHELIHIHLDPMSEVGDETCKDYLGLSTYEMLWHEMHKVIETACESMAAAWSPLLDPVPDKLTSEDDIVIMIVDGGREVSIGEYLKEKGLMSDAVGVQPVE